jgi:hypothetical protein
MDLGILTAQGPHFTKRILAIVATLRQQEPNIGENVARDDASSSDGSTCLVPFSCEQIRRGSRKDYL